MSKKSAVRVLCLAAAGFVLPAGAGDTPEAGALYRHLTQAPFVEGRFTQRRELADIPGTIESRGRFMIWRDHGLYWETSEPLFHATTFTTEQTYQWNEPGAAEPVDDGAFQINRRIASIILALFEADFDRLEDDFSVAGREEGAHWSVTLEPANRHIAKALDRIVIDGAEHIEHVRLDSASGDVTAIDLEVTGSGENPGDEDTDRLSPEAIRACCLKP